MADEQANAPETQDEGKKKGGKLPILIVAALMLLEAGAIYFVLSVMGGPQPATASELEGLEENDRDAMQEILLVSNRFQNMQSGRVWGWDAEIYIKVRQKNVEAVQKTMERNEAEILEGLALIFRRAQDRHLREPGLETLTRQLNTYVNEVFGTDAEGMPIVERVILAKLKGVPEDI